MPGIRSHKPKAARKSKSIKESRAAYAARTHSARPTRNQQMELEFHISLPVGSNTSEFTDKLIERVEAYGGMVAGGTVAQKE
jgi:hypothetical protein